MVDVVGRAVLVVSSKIDQGSFDKDGKKVGNAFRKGALVGVAALGTLVPLLVNSGLAAEEAAQKQRILDRVLKNMGKSGASQELSDVASELSKITGIDDEVIKGGQTILASFKTIASSAGVLGGTFERATRASVDLAASPFFNGNVEAASKALGKALNDPTKGLLALTRAGIPFNAAQKTQIQDFIQANDLASAQALILDEVTRKFGGLAAEGATGSERLKTGIGEVNESVGFLLADLFETEGKKSFIDLAADATFNLSQKVEKFQKSATWRDLRDSMRNFGGDVRTVARALGQIVSGLDRLSEATTGSGLVEWLIAVQDNLSGLSLLADTLDRISRIWDVINGKEAAPFKGSTNAELTDLLLGDFASGGTVGKTGAYRVGETGPEIVTLPRGAHVANSRETRKASGTRVTINQYLMGPQTSIGQVRQADFAYRFAVQGA